MDPLWHPAIAIGVQAMIPLAMWPGLSVYLGLDDYVTFWNDQTEAERLSRLVGEQIGTSIRTEVDSSTGNIFLVRAGFNLLF